MSLMSPRFPGSPALSPVNLLSGSTSTRAARSSPLRGVVGSTLAVLATYRITKLIVSDEVTSDLREAYLDHFGDPQESKAAYLITCPHCVSVYAALLVAGANTIFPDNRLVQAVTAALAYSAVTGIMAEREDSF